MAKALYSDRDIAEQFNCSRSTVWRLVSKKVLSQPIKVGGLTRWRREDIDAALERAAADRVAA